MPERDPDDVFDPAGRVRGDVADRPTFLALAEALAHARNTNWESVRTPHLFMGLLSAPDAAISQWAGRLNYEPKRLIEQFRDLFYQDSPTPNRLHLNREFLSDNVIRLLRDASGRAADNGRNSLTQLDLLITLFRAPNSIVAECFERIGVTAARLTELAVLAEQDAQDAADSIDF